MVGALVGTGSHLGYNESALTSAPYRMDDVWIGKTVSDVSHCPRADSNNSNLKHKNNSNIKFI
jgi:hypothetical protein